MHEILIMGLHLPHNLSTFVNCVIVVVAVLSLFFFLFFLGGVAFSFMFTSKYLSDLAF